MRQCPTLEGDARSLIMHQIGVGVCMSRQREFYHKCHRCAFRGKPASFTPDPQRFGVATGHPPEGAERPEFAGAAAGQ